MKQRDLNSRTSYNANAVDTLEIPSLTRFAVNEIIKTFATTFLHTFETTDKIDWERNSVLVMILQNIKPSKDGALIV